MHMCLPGNQQTKNKKYGRQLKQINLDSTWFRAAERQMLIFSIAAHFRKINDRSSMKNGMKLSEERYPPGKLTQCKKVNKNNAEESKKLQFKSDI
ncbi:hypothetical protein T05_2306 [Trichinella murrelli]|uniref:Uncharacterized protein n=1 Tax=Trichinella murrelli TaxID=144512 RepID=A0A0V0TF61_9BILA|nr:hypothetical protein T05_2306 [Trichinella murrelli]